MKKTRNISKIFSATYLQNKRCFLLGGGPSLKGFDYTLLENEFTIGTNKTFTIFSPSINYSMDKKFFDYVSSPGTTNDQRVLNSAWNAYKGYKIFLHPKRQVKDYPNTWFVDRFIKKTLSLDVCQGIYPGSNSGFGALMLAISLGCKEIYLLGYDMGISANKITHWHNGYPQWGTNENNKKKFKKFIKDFNEFADTIKNENISVINLTSKTCLNCFEKTTIERVFNL